VNLHDRVRALRDHYAMLAPDGGQGWREQGIYANIETRLDALLAQSEEPGEWWCDCGHRGGEIGEMIVGPDGTLVHWNDKEWCQVHGYALAARPAEDGLRDQVVKRALKWGAEQRVTTSRVLCDELMALIAEYDAALTLGKP
jgi:hypothetical protein